jgi:hypothetical protein
VESVLERGRDSEVPAAAAQAPEELGFGPGIDAHPLSLGGHKVDRDEVVHGQAMLAHQVPQAAAQSEPANAGLAHDPGGRRQAEPLRRPVELTQQRAAARPHRACSRVDLDRVHEREVDHQPVVAHGVPGDGVSAAAHRDGQIPFPRETDGLDDIVRARAPGDERRSPVDGAVPDAAGFVVAFLARSD